MKKTALLILVLALCLLAAPIGLAESGPVARSDAFAAYTDGEGHLYLPGRDEAINGKPADSVVGIDAYRVLYLSPDDFLDTRDLYVIDLQSLEESLIATDVKDACLAGEDTAYYVSGANRRQLVRVDLRSLATQVAYTATEAIDRLYMSAEGLIFRLVDQAATMLYVEETGRFEIYSGDMPRSGAIGDQYEVFLTDEAELYLKGRSNYSTSLIDSDVTAFAWLNDTVYYLTRTGSALRLKAYSPQTRTSRIVLTPGVKMKDQLTASGKALFMLAADNTVCRVNTAEGTLAVFKRYSDLTAYKLPAEYSVDGLYIEGMSGQLNVYAQLAEKASKPTFSFIEFESEAEAAAPALRLIDTLKLTGEPTAWDRLKPTPQYAPLSRGSRGDAVSAIQKPLKDLGYYDYYVDGIFGPRTQAAVQLLQFDLERPVTGVADAELQRIILSGKLSAYDPYRQLVKGNRGMRVRQMQERLRELGFLADAADGIFGPRTLKAVQLFQYENGLPESDAATRDTLRRLYSDGASHCASYIDLYPGDTGYRVRELNNRLRDLYYLESSPGSSYTAQTASAVRVFQRTAGLRETGNASVAVQRVLFSSGAPEAPGYIVLRRGDENDRVARLQRRLKDLKYYDGPVDGYFGRQTKEAVALFQKKVGLKPTGIATVRTQKLLFDADAPEYVKPTVIGVPDIYVEEFDYEEDDIYFISEDSAPDGYVIFSWDVEGSVDHYNIRVSDSMGNVYADNDTLMTSTSVPLATLDYDEVYTLRVVAYPEDGDRKHITQAEVGFVRVDAEEESGNYLEGVGLPDIIMDTVARVESGVNYLLPGEISFGWYTEGDVDSYEVRIEDESGDVIVDRSVTETEARMSSDAMTAGEIYTITVSAIPEKGGKKAARSNSARFALPEIELPEPDPTPEPVPEPTPDPTPEPIDEIEDIDAPEEIDLPEEALELMPTLESPAEAEDNGDEGVSAEAEDAEPEEELVLDDVPDGEAIEMPEDEASDEEAAEMPEGEVVDAADEYEAPEVIPDIGEPEEEPEADAPTNAFEAEPEDEAGEAAPEVGGAWVSEPVITLDTVEEVRDGISYISGEVLTMSWQAEGNVSEYRVALLDSNGNLLDSRTVDFNALSAYTSALDPSAVYTLKVTAVPAGGTESDSATASARFALYAVPSDDESDWADDEDEAGDAGDWQASDEAWQNAEEEYQAPEEIEIAPEAEYEAPETDYGEPDPEDEGPEASDEAPEADNTEPETVDEAPWADYEAPELDYGEPEESDLAIGNANLDIDEADLAIDELGPDIDDGALDLPLEDEPDEYDDESDESLSESDIAALQDRLTDLGWLAYDSYIPGLLDDATAYAIFDFQRYCNSMFGMGLAVVDPTDPSVDAETLDAIRYADARYANPNAFLDEATDDGSNSDGYEAPDGADDEGLDDVYDEYDDSEAFELDDDENAFLG